MFMKMKLFLSHKYIFLKFFADVLCLFLCFPMNYVASYKITDQEKPISTSSTRLFSPALALGHAFSHPLYNYMLNILPA